MLLQPGSSRKMAVETLQTPKTLIITRKRESYFPLWCTTLEKRRGHRTVHLSFDSIQRFLRLLTRLYVVCKSYWSKETVGEKTFIYIYKKKGIQHYFIFPEVIQWYNEVILQLFALLLGFCVAFTRNAPIPVSALIPSSCTCTRKNTPIPKPDTSCDVTDRLFCADTGGSIQLITCKLVTFRPKLQFWS